jgi:hypothetical protein
MVHNARSESYFYPFAIEVTFETVPGRPVLEIVEDFYRSLLSGGHKDDINFAEHSRALVKTDDPEFGKIRCSVKRQYKGPLGKALFELLADYGCGYQIEEPQHSDGPTYILTLRRADPSKVFSISISPPDEWKKEIAKHQGTFEPFLKSKGVRLDGLRKLDSFHFPRNIGATGSYAFVQSVWHVVMAAQIQSSELSPEDSGQK